MNADIKRGPCRHFEALEPRHLMAGDVMVDVVEGHLVITGDDADNEIAITQSATLAGADNGSFVITGLNGTTVHLVGSTTGGSQVTATGVRRGAKIEMGDGNDVVSLANATLRGNVSIQMGAGNDQVDIGVNQVADQSVGGTTTNHSVRVQGALRISTDSGEDAVAVHNTFVGGSLGISTGDDNDGVSLGTTVPDMSGTGSTGTVGDPAAGRLPGSIPDPIGGPAPGVETSARLRVGAGVQVNMGDGSDSLSMNQVSAGGSISVQGGEGEDSVHAQLTRALAMTILGGEGIDQVSLDDVNVNHLGVYTGGGNDRVEILDSAFSSLGVFLGDGDDALLMAGVRANFAVLLGGIGNDALTEVRPNQFMFDLIDGFELSTLPPPFEGQPPFPGADWPSSARASR